MTEIERIEAIIEDYEKALDKAQTIEDRFNISGILDGLALGLKLLEEMEERYEGEIRNPFVDM